LRELSDKPIRRGADGNIKGLIALSRAVYRGQQGSPKPFIWTARVHKILPKLALFRDATLARLLLWQRNPIAG
jgi:hypothetical protein